MVLINCGQLCFVLVYVWMYICHFLNNYNVIFLQCDLQMVGQIGIPVFRTECVTVWFMVMAVTDRSGLR
jgi:hypothetical protein